VLSSSFALHGRYERSPAGQKWLPCSVLVTWGIHQPRSPRSKEADPSKLPSPSLRGDFFCLFYPPTFPRLLGQVPLPGQPNRIPWPCSPSTTNNATNKTYNETHRQNTTTWPTFRRSPPPFLRSPLAWFPHTRNPPERDWGVTRPPKLKVTSRPFSMDVYLRRLPVTISTCWWAGRSMAVTTLILSGPYVSMRRSRPRPSSEHDSD